jgi:hypothetical protein
MASTTVPNDSVDGSGYKVLVQEFKSPESFAQAITQTQDVIGTQDISRLPPKIWEVTEKIHAEIQEQQVPELKVLPPSKRIKLDPDDLLNKFVENDLTPVKLPPGLGSYPYDTKTDIARNPPKISNQTVRCNAYFDADHYGGASCEVITATLTRGLPIFGVSGDLLNFHATQEKDISLIAAEPSTADGTSYFHNITSLNVLLYTHSDSLINQFPFAIATRFCPKGYLTSVRPSQGPAYQHMTNELLVEYVKSGYLVNEGSGPDIINLWIACTIPTAPGRHMWWRLVQRTEGLEEDEVKAQDDGSLWLLDRKARLELICKRHATPLSRFPREIKLKRYWRFEPFVWDSKSMLPSYLYNGPGWQGLVRYHGEIIRDNAYRADNPKVYAASVNRVLYQSTNPVMDVMPALPTLTACNIQSRPFAKFI